MLACLHACARVHTRTHARTHTHTLSPSDKIQLLALTVPETHLAYTRAGHARHYQEDVIEVFWPWIRLFRGRDGCMWLYSLTSCPRKLHPTVLASSPKNLQLVSFTEKRLHPTHNCALNCMPKLVRLSSKTSSVKNSMALRLPLRTPFPYLPPSPGKSHVIIICTETQ